MNDTDTDDDDDDVRPRSVEWAALTLEEYKRLDALGLIPHPLTWRPNRRPSRSGRRTYRYLYEEYTGPTIDDYTGNPRDDD